MDEPLSNLDAKLRGHMRAELKYMQQELGITTIYVTHDQIEAMTLAHRIAIMDHGVLQQIGTPRDVYDRPTNLFVAGFMGSPTMNLIQGTVRRGDDPGVEANGHRLPVRAESELIDGQSVIYGIRPEHLDIADSGFPATISVVEPTGSETIVFLRFGETEIVAVFHDWHDFKPGQTLHLRPRADRAHLFDSVTGKRV
jgi:multiple sugar transport system ATP-binding protein